MLSAHSSDSRHSPRKYWEYICFHAPRPTIVYVVVVCRSCRCVVVVLRLKNSKSSGSSSSSASSVVSLGRVGLAAKRLRKKTEDMRLDNGDWSGWRWLIPKPPDLKDAAHDGDALQKEKKEMQASKSDWLSSSSFLQREDQHQSQVVVLAMLSIVLAMKVVLAM